MHYARRRTRRTADRTYQQQATWRRRSRPGRRSRPARACRAPPAPLPLEPASLPLRPAQPPQQRPSRRRGRLHHTDREARPSGPSRLACAWHARPAPLPLEPASAPSLSEPARHPEQRRSRRSGRLHPTDREARPLGPLARLARAWRAWQAPAVPPAVPLRPAHAPERRRPRRSGRPDPAGRHERPPEAQKRDFRLLRCQIPEYRPFGCQIPDFRPLEFEFELPPARASSRRHGAPQAEVAAPRLLGSCQRQLAMGRARWERGGSQVGLSQRWCLSRATHTQTAPARALGCGPMAAALCNGSSACNAPNSTEPRRRSRPQRAAASRACGSRKTAQTRRPMGRAWAVVGVGKQGACAFTAARTSRQTTSRSTSSSATGGLAQIRAGLDARRRRLSCKRRRAAS